MKYTIENIIKDRITIWCTNIDQAQKLWEACGQKSKWGLSGDPKGFEVFLEKGMRPTWCDSQYHGRWFEKNRGSSILISFDAILFDNKNIIYEIY